MRYWNVLNSVILLNAINSYAIQPHVLIKDSETRNKVIVLDTGIQSQIVKDNPEYFCKGDHYDATGASLEDTNGHGTNISGIIAKYINPKKTCLLIVKYTEGKSNGTTLSKLMKSLELISDLPDIQVVNFSSGGGGEYSYEKTLINKIISKSIYFITAAGNQAQNLDTFCDQFPACYAFLNKFFRVVGNGKDPKHKWSSTNYGRILSDWRDGVNVKGFGGITMTGTSQSAAIVSGEIARELEK